MLAGSRPGLTAALALGPVLRHEGRDGMKEDPGGMLVGCRGTRDDAGVPLYAGAPCVSLPSPHLEDRLISSPHPCRERQPSLVSLPQRMLTPGLEEEAGALGLFDAEATGDGGEGGRRSLWGWSRAPSPTARSGHLAPAGRGSGGAAAGAGVSPGPWRPGDVLGGPARPPLSPKHCDTAHVSGHCIEPLLDHDLRLEDRSKGQSLKQR